MADLKTDYLDDILDVSANEQRKYDMVTNSDGTISLLDQTVYMQQGSSLGAKDMNATNTLLNEVNRNLNGFRFGEETDSETGEVTRGYYVYDEEAGTDVLVPFKNASGNKIRRVYRTNSSGTSATYDLTGIDGYEKLTLADIGTIHPRGRTQNTIDGKGELHTSAITKTYDAATGILTINQSDAQGNFLMYSFAELYVVIRPTFSCTVKALETTISGNRTFDLTFIDGWEDIDISQYSFFPSSFSRSNYNLGGDTKSATIVLYYTLSYDKSTGILTLVRDTGNTAEAADFSIELFSNF